MHSNGQNYAVVTMPSFSISVRAFSQLQYHGLDSLFNAFIKLRGLNRQICQADAEFHAENPVTAHSATLETGLESETAVLT